MAMMTAFSAAIAPLVYIAAVLAFCLPYTLGRIVPMTALSRFSTSVRMHRAADLVTRTAPLSHDKRLAMLLDGAPPQIMALHHRYVALALTLNIPGNALIGGGGGIALFVGMSGLFAPLPTILAFAIAVPPVPLVIAILGTSGP